MELVKGKSRIQLYSCVGKLLQERKSRAGTPNPQGRLVNTSFASNAERDQAFENRLRELRAEGWIDQRPPAPAARKRSDEDALEDAFAALVETTIAELGRASEDQDAKIWRRAITAYGKLKIRAGGNRNEHLVHFFAVDGIAIERRHPVVVAEVRATKARKARWVQLLESA